ncbi:MAG: protein kinase [Isosphaerales bacterium]
MTACPSPDLIVELLNDHLQGPELAGIVAHIEECLRCQTHLEELTRAAGRITTLRQVAADVGLEGESAADPTAHDENGPAADGGSAERLEGAGDHPDPAVGSTAPLTDQGQPADPDRTRSQIGSGNGSPKSDPGGPRTDLPSVSGYQVMERLGEGGMGVVYKARQLGLNRLVALKMIRGGSQARPENFKRFTTEAEAVAKLRHPNILQIYDIGEANGLPYVALELLDGGSLDDRLAGTPQPGGFAAELLATLARAVHVAHEAAIIHRDLKPSNVLYTSDGVPKITDFGLAKRIDSDDHQTESGQIMGSPSYMAPEQARGHSREVGPAADVYALGAILYDTLTGRPPFKGETPMETVRQVIDEEPVPPARLVPRLPRDLETICLKCLHKEPARRYETAQALADDLAHYLRGEPILARPTSAWERAGKWAKRRPWAAAALVFSIIAFLGVIGGVFLYQRSSFLWSLQQVQEGNRLIDQASQAKDRDDLTREKTNLSHFLAAVPARTEFDELRSRVEAELNRVDSRIEELRTREAKRTREREERERFQKFRDLRKHAQLYAVRLGVIEPADYQKSLRDSALAALAVYGQDARAPAAAWSPVRPIPEALNQGEKDEVTGGCFDLLLILSEAVGPAEGLKILDRAARLRPERTAAYHLRRAAILFQTGDRAGRVREEQLAAKLQPTTALDYLLIGREQLAREQFRDAIHSSQSAIRLDPDQLGAHLILAVAYFNTQRYSEAKASLITCIQTAPELLGLYLFRALVSGEEGNRALIAINRDAGARGRVAARGGRILRGRRE